MKQQFESGLPFVAYRKPNRTEVKAILQNNDALYKVETFDEKGFVFSPFDEAEDSVILPLNISEVISISNFVNASGKTEFPIESNISSREKEFHLGLVKRGLKVIGTGALKKVVLSRKEEVNLEEANPFLIFKNLLTSYASAFVYIWYHPKVGLWLGATPETLLKIEGRQFSMMSLAGTQSFEGTTDITWKAKELEEQQFVTDFILENIEPYIQNIKVSETQTVRAGNLLHLNTQINGVLNPEILDFKEVLKSLHPTPAVCGVPKADAQRFILDNEKYNREFYTGFLGELNFETKSKPRTGRRNVENRAYTFNKTSTQLYVNLRCMQIQGDKAMIYVGGGITESSNPEKEWAETVSKSLVMKKVLQ
ncbi:chorismate-binding protein [Hyunsoonleella aquatilis]|uniref:chorismate-binding protein n=1 Tax=Hyunsoonleella aquatilis TaxID=2762758 RepID=UPI001FEA3233|nr:chorismate-binding protein [Hyunsoonleella aquatilis]